MSTDISNQKQVFFHPVDMGPDVDSLFAEIIKNQISLQVKPKGREDTGNNALTVLRVYNCIKSIVLAKHGSGPKLFNTDITVVIDIKDEKYFCTASVLEVKAEGYVINFEKIFRLQRRNNFRVPIPENIIKATVKVHRTDASAQKTFRLIDLSAGGFAVAVLPENTDAFEIGSIVNVFIQVGHHDEINVGAKVKYRRKETPRGFPHYYHCGCEFVSTTAAVNQQLAFLVNDCHRQIFARLKSV